jgi:hypothetical protein
MFCEGVNTVCNTALITSVVPKWLPVSFIFNQANREKLGGSGMTVILFFVKNSLVKKEMWYGALSWWNSQFFCRQSSGWSFRTFSCSRRKTPLYYVELTVWPARMNSLWTIPLMSKETITMILLTLLFTCLPIFCLAEFGIFLYCSCFHPWMLV